MSFILSTDTSCDFFKTDLAARNIHYVPLTYAIDGVSYPDDFSTNEEYEEFFDIMAKGAMPTTSQINIYTHEQYFKKLLKENEGDILHLTLSSGLSSTYASALKASENVMEEFPGRNIFVLDTKSATVVHGMVLDDCDNLRKEGRSARETLEIVTNNITRIVPYFMTYDLMHLKRGGRVSGPMAYIGTALNIKPMLTINKEGGLSVINKLHGVPKSLKFIIDRYKAEAVEEPQTVLVGSAASPFAEELADMARKALPQNEVKIGWFGPVIGAHVGKGTVALVFRSKNDRYDPLKK